VEHETDVMNKVHFCLVPFPV